jgi:hypothetical protein
MDDTVNGTEPNEGAASEGGGHTKKQTGNGRLYGKVRITPSWTMDTRIIAPSSVTETSMLECE